MEKHVEGDEAREELTREELNILRRKRIADLSVAATEQLKRKVALAAICVCSVPLLFLVLGFAIRCFRFGAGF